MGRAGPGRRRHFPITPGASPAFVAAAGLGHHFHPASFRRFLGAWEPPAVLLAFGALGGVLLSLSLSRDGARSPRRGAGKDDRDGRRGPVSSGPSCSSSDAPPTAGLDSCAHFGGCQAARDATPRSSAGQLRASFRGCEIHWISARGTRGVPGGRLSPRDELRRARDRRLARVTRRAKLNASPRQAFWPQGMAR